MMNKISLVLLFCLLFSGCHDSIKKRFQGYVEGDNLYLASPNAGIVVSMPVQRGQKVKSGQLLAQLDPKPQSLQVLQLEKEIKQAQHQLQDLIQPKRPQEIASIKAQMEQAEAEMKLAQIRLKRYQILYEKHAVDEDSLDVAVANLTRQQSLKAQYQANLELAHLGARPEQIQAQKEHVQALTEQYNEAKWQLDQKSLYAPDKGIIFDVYYEEGEFVGAQKPLISLLTPNNVHVEFFVPVDNLALIKLGQKITISCFGCTHSTEASISFISPEAQFMPPLVYTRENSDKLVFRIQALFTKPNEYKVGQPVTVDL